MFCLNVWLTAKSDDDVSEVESLLAEMGRLSRAEPGCLRYEVYHSTTDPRRFLLVEHWSDEPAWQAHRLAPAYLQIYQPRVLPRVERDAHRVTRLD
jgi:quinol monooxygenase YgiN